MKRTFQLAFLIAAFVWLGICPQRAAAQQNQNNFNQGTSGSGLPSGCAGTTGQITCSIGFATSGSGASAFAMTEGPCQNLTGSLAPATGVVVLCANNGTGTGVLATAGAVQNVGNAGWTVAGGLTDVTDNVGSNVTFGVPGWFPNGSNSAPSVSFSSVSGNSGLYYSSGVGVAFGGVAKALFTTNFQLNSTMADFATGQNIFDITVARMMKTSGTNNPIIRATNNTCTFALTTATLTTALSPVSLCTYTLPASAQTWTWHCDAIYTVQAGTTPTFSTGETWAQAPSAAFGEAVIWTAASGATTQAAITTTTNSNIATTGTLTPATASLHVEWDGNFTGSATSGVFSPTASVAGTSATGTLQGQCTIL